MNTNHQKTIFQCRPSENGYDWTIISRLGDMLNRAEAMYGPRDKDFTILGVEIAEISQPQIWFPGDCGCLS